MRSDRNYFPFYYSDGHVELKLVVDWENTPYWYGELNKSKNRMFKRELFISRNKKFAKYFPLYIEVE